MTTTITRRAYWVVLSMVLALFFTPGLFAQSRPASASPVARDLNATLAELMRTAPATDQDLSIAQHQGGRLHRVAFWRGEKTNKVQMTTALSRNLQFAVPSLVHDAQASGGSISTTFALYKDLTVVCESLDSLLPPGSREGKTELTALNNDLSDMNRLREELSSYIQQTAASMENKNSPFLSSTNRPVKKIIVDDTIPEKSTPKKRRTSNE